MGKETFVNIGKAGFYAEFFSRLPTDTDIILGDDFWASSYITPKSLKFNIAGSQIEHTIRLNEEGKLISKVKIPLHIDWNREDNIGCKELIHELIDMYLYRSGYDRRKLPKVASLANTIANNPYAFFDTLGEFQKKYKRNKEIHDN